MSNHPLVLELFSLAKEKRVNVTRLAREAGVDRQAIRAWRSTSNPTVTSLEAALNVLGYRLAIVPDNQPSPP